MKFTEVAGKTSHATTIAGLALLVLLVGCLPIAATRDAARRHASPDSWARTDGTPATKDDTDRCIDLSGLKLASMNTVDAKLASFDACMRDHGLKMK